MNKNTQTVLLVVVIIIVVLAVVFKKPHKVEVTGEPIKIGFMGPMTGELANMGSNARAAVEIAVEEINSEGGINGQPIEVVYEDDVCKGDKAVSAATKLVNIDHVVAIVGPLCSPATLAAAPVVEAAHVPIMSYAATNPGVTNAGDYTFRNVPSDLFQGVRAAEHIKDTLKVSKTAILYVNNEWGTGLEKSFSDSYKKLGGTVTVSEKYNADSSDLRSQLTKIKNSGAEAIYFLGFPDGTTAGIKQAKELGIKLPILGADAWDDDAMWKKIGTQANGVMYTTISTNSTDSFRVKMKEKLNDDTISYVSNFAYDATKMYAQAMAKTEHNTGEEIKNALYTIVYRDGVSAKEISFDKNGDPKTAEYTIKTVDVK